VSGTLLLRGGTVLTLGAKTPNLPTGDVLIDDGRIAEVGTAVRPPRDAEQIDCTDAIVMPGFVDTHRHTWTSLFRNAGETLDAERSAAAFRDHYGADDVYAATFVGLLGAIEAGITAVVDQVDVAADGEALEAAARAHADSGVRTVLVQAGTTPTRGADVVALASSVGSIADVDSVGEAWAAARAAGMRIHVHAGERSAGPGVVAALAERGLLGSDVTFVHHTALDDADVRAIAEAGAAVSLAPSAEMASGYGSPPIQELMDRDVRPGLGVDHERVAPGDMFAQMRQTISLQHATVFDRKLMGKGSLPKLMSTRDVIRYATVDGARAAGFDGIAGSIEPGLQADVIVLRTDRPNVWPINDPIGAVVWGMDTSNISHVVVGGRVLLRDGALTADVGAARELATTARERVVASAGLSPAGAAR
jgi:cytosine/adenosine deaminase-related metal-dependent hydrolase